MYFTKFVFIAMTSLIIISSAARAADPRLLLPVARAADPYQAKVGDKQVTSVTRPVTRGPGLSRQELLDAARTSQPLQAVPSNAMPNIPSGNSAPPNSNSSNDDRR